MKGFSRQELLEMAWEKPILAQVEITSKCNQCCLFCYAGQKPVLAEGKPDLTLYQWQSIITKLRNLGVRRLDFTGRESFMYSDFVALAAWSKQQGFELRVNTNGTFDVSEVLGNVDEIIFSVHGLSDTHDRITKNSGAFNLIEENIQRTVKSGVKASINMSLLRSNYEQLNEVYDYFSSRYDINKFAPSFPIASLFGSEFAAEELVLDQKLVSDYVSRLKKIPADKLVLKHGFHSIFISDRKHYHDNGLLLPNCAAGKHKLIVESDGRVFPCNFFKSEEFFCGNMLTDDEFKIWKLGAGFNRFRELILQEKIPEECTKCLKKPRCYSGCRAWSLTYKEGGFENVKDKRCDLGSAFA